MFLFFAEAVLLKNVHPLKICQRPGPANSCSSNRFPARCLPIALVMEAVSTPETSFNVYDTTRPGIPKDCHL
jgi:hypothetical protein